MNQGQQALPAQAPPAQPALPAPQPPPPAPQMPPPAGPAPPAPAFALGPGHSHAVLNFDDPNTGEWGRSYTTKRSRRLKVNSMEKPITWLFSLRVYAIVLAVSIGSGSSLCMCPRVVEGNLPVVSE